MNDREAIFAAEEIGRLIAEYKRVDCGKEMAGLSVGEKLLKLNSIHSNK